MYSFCIHYMPVFTTTKNSAQIKTALGPNHRDGYLKSQEIYIITL